MNLEIKRAGVIKETIHADEKAKIVQQLMGSDQLVFSCSSPRKLDVAISDVIQVGSKYYTLNQLPQVKKISSNKFEYSFIFEGEVYDLGKVMFLDSDGRAEFDLLADVEDLIDLIVSNMGRQSVAFVKGTVDSTDSRLMNFRNETCLNVLNRISTEFDVEFYLNGYQINVTEAGSDIGETFEYGKNKGLYELSRNQNSNQNIVTRLYAFGSDKNLGSDYRTEESGTATGGAVAYLYDTSKSWTDDEWIGLEIKITAGTGEGQVRIIEDNVSNALEVSENWDTTPSTDSEYIIIDRTKRLVFSSKYLENNITTYGVIEKSMIWDEIFPSRTGTATASSSGLTVYDTSMDFDLNDYLIDGLTAKMHFQTGYLAGFEFEISEYDHSTKKFTIVANNDSAGYVMPNDTLKVQAGDTYKLIDIALPQSYITTAETELQTKAQAYIDENSDPLVSYKLKVDELYLKRNSLSLSLGDKITVIDSDLGISSLIRIISVTNYLNREYKYEIEVSDHIQPQLIQRIYRDVNTVKHENKISNVGDVLLARRNYKSTQELLNAVYDVDNYFDMDNIRPLSVETSMLAVGNKSQQLILSEVQLQPNYSGNAANFEASGGSLTHLTINDTITTWTLQSNSYSSLTSGTVYYIYAKCHKTDTAHSGNTIVLDSTQRTVDADSTYYYFLVGVLHSVVDSVRAISLTYGQTTINGKFITTGKIQSSGGQTYFDLDNNEMQIKKDASNYMQLHYTSSANWGIKGVAGGATVFQLGSTNKIASTDGKTYFDLDNNILAVAKDASNQVYMYYTDASNWGILGYSGGNAIFKLGSTNEIAGWTFDNEAIYTGTKQSGDGYSSSGISIVDDGSIHAENFHIDADGGVGLRSSGSGQRIEISKADNNLTLYYDSDKYVRIDDNIQYGVGRPGLIARESSTKITTIAAGDLLVLPDTSYYLKVDKDSYGLKVAMRGIPTSSSDCALHELYNDSGTLKIKT